MSEKKTAKKAVRSRPWWPWAKRALTLLFFALVAWLLMSQARSVEWEKVSAAIRRKPHGDLLIAAGLAACSFALYSCFDLFGRRITGHSLPTARVMTVNFVSYAFNLNLGALVGGVAFRYRLYSRFGLDTPVVTRVVAMSMLTNWLGYVLLAGITFSWWPIPLPPDWKLGTLGLRVLGFALCGVAAAYVLLCAFSRRRSWSLRGHEIELPSLRMALLQLAMSSVNWLLIAGAVFMLLERKVAFTTVLGTFLVSAIAGVITHVPAGIGVLEAVFVALLSPRVPESEVLAAMLAFRVVYYLIPLTMAVLLYLLLEARAKKERA